MSPPSLGAVPLFFCCAIAGTTLAAQSPAPARLDWSAEDSNRVAWLEQHGYTISGRHAVVLAPPDSFAMLWHRTLADSLDRGVAALRRTMGAPYPWQRIGERPVKFYLSPDRFVSHASGDDAVFISMARVRSGTAPYLHEAAHVLLAPRAPFFGWEYADTVAGERVTARMPLWLLEGMADYLAQTVAGQEGLHEGDVFAIGGLAVVDSVCAARATASPRRGELLAVVGATGRLEALFTIDRATVAPAFYACAQSMTRFLVERLGVRQVAALWPAMKTNTWEQEIARAAGVSLSELRRSWLERLGLRER